MARKGAAAAAIALAVAASGAAIAGADGPRSAPAASERATNQSPRAKFNVNPASPSVDQRTRFNGAGSTDSDGSIVTYAWDYGDGGRKRESDPTSTHTYRQAGTYTATLTVTDNQGCTAGDDYLECLRSERATTAKTVVVVDRGVAKPKIQAPSVQPQSPRRTRIALSAGAGEQVRAVATGGVRIEGRSKRLALARAEVDVPPDQTLPLSLVLKNRASNKRVRKALRDGRAVRATLFVKLVDGASNEVRQTRTVLLTR